MLRSTGKREAFEVERRRDNETKYLDIEQRDSTKPQQRADDDHDPRSSPRDFARSDSASKTEQYEVGPASVPVAVLIAIAGSTRGEVHRIMNGETLLGRNSICSITIQKSVVSDEQLKIVHAGGEFFPAKLNSTNEISVNDVDVAEYVDLCDGDVIDTVGHRFNSRTPYPNG